MNTETAAPEAEPHSPIRNFSVRLSPTPRGARLARLLATEQLRAWGLPLDPARHIVAELAANSATHGRAQGRDFGLTLYVVGGTLRIEVTDTCERLPTAQPPSPDSQSGRGLLLVEALADRWGTAPGLPPRKTVWAEVTVRQAPEPADVRSGATGGLSPKDPGEKEPHQTPPLLPPGGRSHPRG
ncbi:ATP-binding protein [Streptomyces sp. NBC_00487]|uniref:ATP-binding protein n=1 Tax=unclassified Streptomyces TaxID=2593676 RepID=UPI002DD7D9AC|nr:MULTISPECIES: ATP-binding protein [unclassified Streptomyces]WRY96323.1 ATP-binding protein [Streptomyces sp. NBC_00481]